MFPIRTSLVIFITLIVSRDGNSFEKTESQDDSVSNSHSRVKRQFGGFHNQGGFFPQGQRFPQQGGFPHHQGGFFPQNQGFGQQGFFPQNQGSGSHGNQGIHSAQHFGRKPPPKFVRGPNGQFIPAGQGGPQGHGHGHNHHNCNGNRRRRPECQGFNQGGGFKDQSGGSGHQPNCKGKRKNRPECNVATEALTDQNVIHAFESIDWLKQLTTDNHSVALPNLPDTPSSQSQSRNFLLGVDQQDQPFQSCTTPRFEPGHCRFLQHCILNEFRFSFNIFLRYVCFIDGRYVGVCCPDSRYPNFVPTTTTSTTTTTTPRPTTPPAFARGCGLTAKNDLRIVGGRDADPQEWPWMAALLRDGNTQFCGGVLISSRHVLTAEHCVRGFDENTITVRLGEYTFDSDTDTPHLDVRPLQIRHHTGYNTTTFVNDIAILVLPNSVQFNDNIWPVCLPQPGPLYTAEQATVTGWGTIYYGGPVAKTLQEVTIPVWDNKECDDTYEQTIVDTVLCAGAKAGGQDSCQGDSGGPLLLKPASTGQWTVIGVVSWGIRCADPGFPGVYTRVNRYLDWLQANMV